MHPTASSHCIAFEGFERIASGEIKNVVAKTKAVLERGERAPVLVFDETTSELLEVDFRGPLGDVLRRLELPETRSSVDSAGRHAKGATDSTPRGRGRPKLGVVAREVTLLPRHWEWLSAQPGGASVALRKLVDDARRSRQTADAIRRGQEAAYRFLHALAGNLPGFEEVTRALFAPNAEKFHELTETWPTDVRNHARRLAAAAFEPTAPSKPAS